MSDKVFWSILGGILLGWVILFVLLVLPKMQAYDSVSADLKSKHRTLDKFSKRTDRDLPTQRLINKEEEFLQSWKKEIDRAEEFYTSRKFRFEEGASDDLSGWSTRYRDDFDFLVKKYRRHAGLADDAELPFEIQEDISNVDEIVNYERRWKVQFHLVDLIVNTRGTSIVELLVDKKSGRSARNKNVDSESFPVVLKLRIPASKSVSFVDQILKHTFIDYSIDQLVVTKDRSQLLFDIVEEMKKEDVDRSEPAVFLKLKMEVHEGAVMEPSEEERG